MSSERARGVQVGVALYALAKRRPSAASLLSAGVLSCGLAAPFALKRIWSAIMKRIFGRMVALALTVVNDGANASMAA